MAIGNYGQLKTAVASWLARTDLTTPIPDFIALAESQIRQDIRCRAMEQSATGTLSSTTLALPTRFAEARRVIVGGYTVNYVTPERFQAIRESQTGHYTIIGESFHFQSSTDAYQIDYYQWFAALSSDSDTNWLLTNHPGIYLYSSLAEACDYTMDDRGRYQSKYQEALAKLRLAEARFTGPLTVRVDGVV